MTTRRTIRPLTDIQEKVLNYMMGFQAHEDRMPTSRELTAQFGWSSQTAAMTHLRALERKGELERRIDPNVNRMWWRFARKGSYESDQICR